MQLPASGSSTAACKKRLYSSASELEPQSELEVPGQIARCIGCDRAEARLFECRVRRCEARMVQEVEDLGSHLQLHAFFDRERLVEIGIEIVDTVDPQTGKVARSVARVLVARIRKAVAIEE
jgi:hypothetical protein